MSKKNSRATKSMAISQNELDDKDKKIHSLADGLGGYKSSNRRYQKMVRSLKSENASLNNENMSMSTSVDSANKAMSAVDDAVPKSLSCSAAVKSASLAKDSYDAAITSAQAVSASAMSEKAEATSVYNSALSSASIGAVANSMARRRYSVSASRDVASARNSAEQMRVNFQRGHQTVIKQAQQAINRQIQVNAQREHNLISYIIDLAPNEPLAQILMLVCIRAHNDMTMIDRKNLNRNYRAVMNTAAYKIISQRYGKVFYRLLGSQENRLMTHRLIGLSKSSLKEWANYIRRLISSRTYDEAVQRYERQRNKNSRNRKR